MLLLNACFHAETNDFDQQMACIGPVRWLKYTAPRPLYKLWRQTILKPFMFIIRMVTVIFLQNFSSFSPLKLFWVWENWKKFYGDSRDLARRRRYINTREIRITRITILARSLSLSLHLSLSFFSLSFLFLWRTDELR